MQCAVDVPRPGANAFGLRPLHHGLEAVLIEPEHLVRRLDDHGQLVVILAPVDAGAVRRRAEPVNPLRTPATRLARPMQTGRWPWQRRSS